jgi:hypothetical protein
MVYYRMFHGERLAILTKYAASMGEKSFEYGNTEFHSR